MAAAQWGGEVAAEFSVGASPSRDWLPIERCLRRTKSEDSFKPPYQCPIYYIPSRLKFIEPGTSFYHSFNEMGGKYTPSAPLLASDASLVTYRLQY